jgi:hypothetical protein
MDRPAFFNPGCALSLYKPEMENRILDFLNRAYGDTILHKICCRHEPRLPEGSLIVNVCAGCDRRFRSLYAGITTVSLWEIIDGQGAFDFPDYGGFQMSLHDPCPVRERPPVHRAVRSLLRKMNVDVIEPAFNGPRSVCCGDDAYPAAPIETVRGLMKKRADSMPREDVAVYCVSCVKAMHIGGKRPRHLVDLLMNETTEPQTYDTAAWHEQLQAYIDAH